MHELNRCLIYCILPLLSATCDSCCGDCNMMKYTYTEAFFIAHCVAVAKHNVGVTSWPGDVDDDEEETDDHDEPGREVAEAGRACGEAEEADDEPAVDRSTRLKPTVLAWDSWEGDDPKDTLLDDVDELAVEEDAPDEGDPGSGEREAPAVPNPFAEFEFRESKSGMMGEPQ